MYHHRQTYKPTPAETKGRIWFTAFCACLIFAIIGCLLAARG